MHPIAQAAPSLGLPEASAAAAVDLIDPTADTSWDDVLADFPEATIFHTSAWARVLRDTYGFTPLYIALRAPLGPSDRLQSSRLIRSIPTLPTPVIRLTSSISVHPGPAAVLPLMEVRSWLTGRRGVSLPFTDSCPPLGSRSDHPRQVYEQALQLARSRGWRYLECRGVGAVALGATPSISYSSHVLDLTVGEATLHAAVDSANLRAIRKAGKAGIRTSIAYDLSAVHTFYRLHCLTRKRHGQPPQPFRFFAAIQRHLLAPRHGFIVQASLGRTPLASNLYLVRGKSAVYKFGAADLRFQELRASNLVMWEGIKHAAQLGCGTLDFGRTSIGQDGLRRFKRSWGAKETSLAYVRHDLRTNKAVTVEDPTTGWHQRLIRALPIPLARLVGTILYRHVA